MFTIQGNTQVMFDLVLILTAAVCTVSGQSITITGPSTLETPTSELRLTCTPSSAGITDISIISLQKNSSSTNYQTVVSVAYNQGTSISVINWGNVVSQSRAGVSAAGNVDTVSGAQLVFTIATYRTNCNDGGAYRCSMGVTLTGGSGGVADAEKYVTAKVQPISTNDMTVFPFPNVESVYYSMGSSLTFTCTGTVGSDKKKHTWCYKRATDQGYTGYPTAADINQNDNGLTSSGCNYLRTSTLTYNVTNEDTNTTFMCEPFTGPVCGSNPASLITYKSIRRYSSGGTTGGQGDTGDVFTTTTLVSAPNTDDVIPWIIVAFIFITATVVLSTTVAFLCRKLLEYKECLHQRVNYEVVNRGFSRNDEHVYNTTDN